VASRRRCPGVRASSVPRHARCPANTPTGSTLPEKTTLSLQRHGSSQCQTCVQFERVRSRFTCRQNRVGVAADVQHVGPAGGMRGGYHALLVRQAKARTWPAKSCPARWTVAVETMSTLLRHQPIIWQSRRAVSSTRRTSGSCSGSARSSATLRRAQHARQRERTWSQLPRR